MVQNNAFPSWVDTAKTFIGLREYPGSASNPTILGWAKALGRKLGVAYLSDDVPWCGLFVAHCMDVNGVALPSIPVRASAWATWGVALAKPSYGAVLVFTRQGGGHVGLYVSEDLENYHVLGGNQSDAVNITKIAKSRCSAIRWPSDVALPKSGPIFNTVVGSVSTNEA